MNAAVMFRAVMMMPEKRARVSRKPRLRWVFAGKNGRDPRWRVATMKDRYIAKVSGIWLMRTKFCYWW